jgi:hypothetical protein
VWLEQPDDANWRFVTSAGSPLAGGSFARPGAETWYSVKIEFTDTPSNRAICSVDGTQRAFFTSNLPLTDILHSWFSIGFVFTAAGGGTTLHEIDCDRVDLSFPGMADAP